MTTANPRSIFTALVVFVALNCLSAGLPDLTPATLKVPGIVVGPPRPEVLVTWTVTNQGGSGANYWSDTFYVSTNVTLTPDALYVGESGAPWPLLPGDYYEQTRILSLPVYTSGNYFLFVIANGWNSFTESTETNNLAATAFEFICTPPDLAPVALSIPLQLTTNANPSLSIAWGVTNQGIGPTTHPWTASMMISTDPILDLSDSWFASTYVEEVVPAGGSLWRTNDIRLPIQQSGTYYIFLSSGWDDPRLEPNNTNNVLMSSVQVTIVDPDLLPIHLGVGSATTNVAANPVVSIFWGVTNQGPGSAVPVGYWEDNVYFSRDAVWDPSDIYLFNTWESGLVPSGTAYWKTNSSTLPITTNGTYYLILNVDNYQRLQEVSDSNNQLAVPVTFSLSHPDLAPLVATVPGRITNSPNPILQLAWGVTNQGSGPAAGYQSDRVMLSTRSTLDNSAVQLEENFRWSPIPSGASLWNTNQLQLPVKQSGDYFLLIVADTGNPGTDLNPADNLLSIPISIEIVPPDLAASAFQAPPDFTGSANPSFRMAWRVENRGAGSTGSGNSWMDSIFLSSNATLDSSDREIYSPWEYGPVAAGAGYWRTNTVQIPTSLSGDYFLFFVTDSHSMTVDSDRNNNGLMVPIHLSIREPDLVPLVLDMPLSITGAPNPTVAIVWAVTNQGAGDARPHWGDGVWVSRDAFRDNNNDVSIADQLNWSMLQAGQRLVYTNQVRIPCTSNGTYYLIFEANRGRQLEEGNLSNNLLAVPFEFHMVFPDLAPVAFQVPASIVAPPYPTVLVSWCITNQGPGAARSSNWWDTWHDRLYLSGDAVLDPGDLPFSHNNDWGVSAILPPDGSYWSTNVQAQIPVQETGDYYLILSTDWSDTVMEASESNNTIVAPFRYELRRSDLATLLVDVPRKVVGPPNPRMNLVWAVTNQGPIEAAAPYSWKNWIFFSRDSVYDWSDQGLDGEYISTVVSPGERIQFTNSVRPPVLESGTYYLTFKADAENNILESNENNNTVTVPIDFTVLKPDLIPYELQVPELVVGPPKPYLQIRWAVTNQGPGAADWYCSERVTLSTNPVPSRADATIASVSDGVLIPADGVVWRSVAAQTEIVQSGNYYLTVWLNEDHALLETDYANNYLTVPVSIQIQPPDLVPLTAGVPAELTGPPNPRLTLSWGVKNQGAGLAKGGWIDTVYFSRDGNYDWGDHEVVSTWRDDLAAGASQWTTSEVRLPCVESGEYYLIFRADRNGYLYESNSLNNLLVVPIRVRIERADLVVSVDGLPEQVTCSPNPKFPINWTVKNNGTGLAEALWSGLDAVYISTNGILAEATRVIESIYDSYPLAAGATNKHRSSPRLPVVDSGRYFLVFVADALNTIPETDESNNQVVVPVDFEVLRPDLAPTLLVAPAEFTGPPSPLLTFAYGVTNFGPGDVEGATWTDALYISTNSIFDDRATLVQTFSYANTVLSGDSYWSTNSVHLPVTTSGQHYLFLRVDPYRSLFESDTANNEISASLKLIVLPPDLAPVALSFTNSPVSPPNPSIQVTWAVTNLGIGPALSYWTDEVFLSKDSTLNNSAVRVHSQSWYNPLLPGDSYLRRETVNLPVVESGDYFLFLRVNFRDQLFESDFSNNVASVPIRLEIGLPDLSPTLLRVTNLVAGTQNPIVWLTLSVTNQGTVPAIGNQGWFRFDSVYLSKEPKINPAAREVSIGSAPGPLPAHSSYSRLERVVLPVLESGQYYLLFVVDSQDRVLEAREDNNLLVAPITVSIDPPDLAPFVLTVPNVVTGSPNTSIPFIAGITNQGIGDASAGWWDSVYLSENGTLDTDDDYRVLGLYSGSRGPVPSGGLYWQTNSFQLPAAMVPSEPLQSTNLFLIFAANENQGLNESSLANNVLVVPFQFVRQSAPDLALLDFKILQVVAGSPNPVATISWGVTNQGPGSAEYWSDNLFIATNSVLNPYEFYQGVENWYGPGPLATGESYWRTNTVTLPVTESRDWYLVLVTDSYHQTSDAVLTNNTRAIPISLQVDLPDIEVLSIVVQRVITGSCYPDVSIAWAVTNRGPGSASGRQWGDALYLSDNPDFPAMHMGSSPAGLEGEATSYWNTNTFRLPLLESGDYYLTVRTADYGYLPESNVANNQLTVPITFHRVDPDLLPIALVAPNTLSGGTRPLVTLAWGVTNSSPIAATQGRLDAVYLSRSPTRDGTEQQVDGFFSDSLPGLDSYWVTNRVQLPIAESGRYYLILVVNSDDRICESNTSNNNLTQEIWVTIQPPDLALTALSAPAIVKGVPYPEMSVVSCLTNCGPGPAAGFRYNEVYISVTPFLDASARFAASWEETNTLPAGAAEWRTNTFRAPVVCNGDYYLIFRARAPDLFPGIPVLNQEAVVPVHFDISLPPDLGIVSFSVPRVVTGQAYPKVDVSWTVENQGLGPAAGSWHDDIWLESADSAHVSLGTFWETHALNPGNSYQRTQPMALPITETGTYFLTLRVNDSWSLYENSGLGNYSTVQFDFVRTDELSPVLVAEGFQADGFHLSVHGTAGKTYRLMASSDLAHWERVLDFQCPEVQARFIDPSASANTQRFYQVVAGFVPEPLRLSFTLQGSPAEAVSLTLEGPPASSYCIETSDDLQQWNVLTNLSGAITPLQFRDDAPVEGQKFYRAVRSP